jgi:hypothetical protein
MLDVDPEPVEITSHPQVVDDVVVEHPPHREYLQTLPTLQTVFHQLGHGLSFLVKALAGGCRAIPGRMYNAAYEVGRVGPSDNR